MSNDKYLKLYKLETNLIDHNKNTLENSLDFTKRKDDVVVHEFLMQAFMSLSRRIIMINMNIFFQISQ